MSKLLELTGKRFGKLTIVSIETRKNGYSYWKCLCDCGQEKVIRGAYLTQKRCPVRSCGCLIKEKAPMNLPKHKCITHNMSKTKFYNVWNSMVMRCANTNSKSYSNYGGRGIKVCDRWRVFNNFYDDMFSGYKNGLSIDRVDNNKGYSHENCRWVDNKTQCNNRSSNHILNYKGVEYTLAEAAEKFNVSYHVLKRRLYSGWTIDEAIEISINGVRRSKNV